MEIIPVRYEDGLVCDMERVMKEHRYSTKTEFIREAVRDKIKDLEKEAALLRLQQAYGAGAKKGRKITSSDLHRAREIAAREIAKKHGVDLD